MLICMLLAIFQGVVRAQGGADYGRGPETDPVATALSGAVSGRVAVVEGRTNAWNTGAALATSVSGRVAVVEGRTNAWDTGATLATSVSGQVAVIEGRTNAWNGATSNSTDWTNHAAGMLANYTNIIITADAKTNTIIVERGSIKSWTVGE